MQSRMILNRNRAIPQYRVTTLLPKTIQIILIAATAHTVAIAEEVVAAIAEVVAIAEVGVVIVDKFTFPGGATVV